MHSAIVKCFRTSSSLIIIANWLSLFLHEAGPIKVRFK
jgi:hypothetical protein